MASQGLPVPAPFHSRHTSLIGSNTWSYLRARPSSKPKGTVLLLHGFPSLPYDWRYQVSLFTSLGYQVIAPYMLGYGYTSSPSEVAEFSFKRQSDDLASLLDQLVPSEQVILGGHDWGGDLVWRFAIYHPRLFKAIFSITFPYIPPSLNYTDLADRIAAGELRMFGYQLQMRDPSTDRKIQSARQIRRFLVGAYGGATPEGERAFSPCSGMDFALLPRLRPSPLLDGVELDRHVAEYTRHGFRGPLNWYRTARINYEDELPIAEEEEGGGHRFTMPALFVQALRDDILVPELAVGMERHFERLTRVDVDTAHWAMIEGPEEVNEAIRGWLETLE
ncbi:alpha/beta-hydrolase [Hypoxylon fragiforme]|uniref:alpha/beta-hydrolase n=1 Tax=Hypoxylon fragiforme TaxID=63214 RepID=UPI0020C6B60B|nr:alpha/beta-hydrolase [Hypoxylon fragiforme]KAI2614301.1 alpha/beta-hydrolase [Hypoxylon fragiforme]